MFNFIKNKLSKLYTQFSKKAHALFSRTTIDQATLKELEQLLIAADTGIKTTTTILEKLQERLNNGTITTGTDLHSALQQLLLDLIITTDCSNKTVYLLVGINGSGKTTSVGKLAHQLQQQSQKVLLIAGDTFRAAATQQLAQWAERAQVDILIGKEGQDPASVIFEGCQKFKQGNYTRLIIDTAGRLQTKINLMHELEKIKRVILKHFDADQCCTLLTIDAMLGQNSFEQAKLFNESTQVDGIILTKMDGTGKGGIVFAINQTLNIPICFIACGEDIQSFYPFKADEFVKQLLAE